MKSRKKNYQLKIFPKKKVSQVKEFNDLLSNEINSREADFWFHCKKISLFQRNVRLYTALWLELQRELLLLS